MAKRFERKTPAALTLVESLIASFTAGEGNNAPELTHELLDLLTEAYREAFRAT